jgi:L-aspartate oxidase
VAPAAHYSMGGVVADSCGRTAVPGLLAAGECARTGFHGANRLASNSLLEAVAVGRRAARTALAGTSILRGGKRGGGRTQKRTTGGELTLEDVRRILSRSAGPLRSAGVLDDARRGLIGGVGATEAAETARRLSCMVLEAALVREESRGAHVRTDHPQEVGDWASREVVVTQAGLEVNERLWR